MNKQIVVHTHGQGLYEITHEVESLLSQTNIEDGLCVIFLQHTSASLIIQENADPSAKRDLEYFLNKLVPENDPGFTHIFEGSDDMPSHIKAALTASSLSIPILGTELALGTWQGVYVWEHRKAAQKRNLVITLMSK